MSYLGRSAKLSRKTQEKVSFLATAGQTSKTGLSYVPTFVEVSVNGILLTDVTDYTATSGSSITFSVALELNDEVTVVSLKTFALADHYTKVESDAAHYTKSAADARFEPIDSAYTKAEADANLAALVDSSPAALNTLNELAAALGDDANFSTTITNSIATKLPLAGGTMTGDTDHADNAKARFGNSDDLQIYHDGSHSNIEDTGTGNLNIRGSNLWLTKPDGTVYFGGVNSNGESRVYFNGSQKLTTTSTGVDVTGTATADVVTVTPNSGNISITAGSYDSTNNVRLNAGGTTSTYLEYRGYKGHIFDVNTTQAMIIDSNRNVGIGTASPVSPNVAGTFVEIEDAVAASLVINDTGQANPYELIAGGDKFSLRYGDADLAVFKNSGNVGIGEASPSEMLHIKDSGNDDPFGGLIIKANNGSANVKYGWRGLDGSDQLRFATSATERMRIDSSGNVLVGKTAISGAVAGCELRANGQGLFTRSGGNPMQMRRLSDNGNIISFYKDTTNVGSIGTFGDDLLVQNDLTGLRFSDSSDAIFPVIATGGASNGNTDLGLSNARFKDLYLSGGVYLGGNGAANKLDDYEEGDWTPTGTNFTVNNVYQARYTKIGRQVTVNAYITGTGGGGGYANVQGLPFTVIAQGYSVGNLDITATNANLPSKAIRCQPNSTYFIFQKNNDQNVSGSEIDGGHIIFTLTYFTT